MSFILRPATALSRATRRAAPSTARQPLSLRSRALTTTPFLRAQGYGDGEGDPARENNEPTSKAQENAEHPGPEAPAASGSPEEASAQSGGSRSKEAKETGSSPTGGQVGNTGVGSEPKIQGNTTPGAEGEEKKQEVEEHNKEFEKRHDRASPAADDKVDKKFWEGQGGHKKT